MPEPVPRIFQLQAACCPVRIVRFDHPGHAMNKLAERALSLGWRYQEDGTWICDHHIQEPTP